MNTLADLWLVVVGPDGAPERLTLLQMSMRAVLIYTAGTVLLRLGGPRLLGRYSTVEFVLAIVLGSVLSRAVNGTAPFVPTVGAMALLLVLHRGVIELANRTRWASRTVKGTARPLVLDGRIVEGALLRNALGAHDLEEAFRQAGHSPMSDLVREVWLERDGRISVLAWDQPRPRSAE